MKLVRSNYNEDTGVSTATIIHNGEYFTAEVTLHAEDADIASSFAGCQFAEIRAIIQMLRKRWMDGKAKLEILQNTYDQMTLTRNFEAFEHTRPMQFMRKQIAVQRNFVYVAEGEYRDLKCAYPSIVDSRLGMARRMPETIEVLHAKREAIDLSPEAE